MTTANSKQVKKKETIEEQLQRLFESTKSAISKEFTWQHFSDADVSEIFVETLEELNDTIRQAQIRVLDMNAEISE